ncbi:hypothetical protein QQP08_024254 [Theobroma cacao]|nr:hypothetical protein QQP08_024254 [Theobroma cacao]
MNKLKKSSLLINPPRFQLVRGIMTAPDLALLFVSQKCVLRANAFANLLCNSLMIVQNEANVAQKIATAEQKQGQM